MLPSVQRHLVGILKLQRLSYLKPVGIRWKHTSSNDKPEDDTPVAYSKSKAATWTARQSNTGGQSTEPPSIQTYSVCLSMAIFLIYFCALREENDIDRILETSLYDKIPGLEKTQLRIALKYNEENGLETEALKKKISEVEELEKADTAGK